MVGCIGSQPKLLPIDDPEAKMRAIELRKEMRPLRKISQEMNLMHTAERAGESD